MRVLIRSWSRQGGERTSVDRIVEAHILRIGRGTDQDLELADLRLALAQAEIVRRGRNAFLLGKPGAAILHNGENVKEHKLKSGDVFEIGRFRLQINPAPAGAADFQLDVDEQISQRDERTQRLARLRTSLADLKISRRALSWMLFFLVLLPSLAVPAWLRFGPPAGNDGDTHRAPALLSDRLWKPGELSSAHAYFRNDCAKCHQQAFVRIRDEDCLACHRNVHSHIADAHLASLPAFAAARCEDCHVEHKGANARLVDRRNAVCTDCHARMQEKFPGAKLLSVANFSHQHPAFSPQVPQFDAASGTFDWVAAADAQPQTNLKFPHAKHLDPTGIESPTGRKTLGCADCHEADASGRSFKPVQMQSHCAQCHRLDFDPGDPSRLLQHAQPAEVAATIRDFYAHEALAGGSDIVGAPDIVRRPHRPAQQIDPVQAHAALQWADRRSSLVIDEVFNTRTCIFCHTVQATGDAATPFAILPVAPQREHRMRGAIGFDHAVHRDEPCGSCHAAATSKSSADMLLPDIKRCRDCHGDPGTAAKIQSTCVDCHGYHVTDGTRIASAPPKPLPPAVATGTPQ
jgi:predicted CXXCH cytochrome family protein